MARRLSVDHIVEYGLECFRALGDRVKNWISINEPLVYTFLGYIQGNHAPAHRLDMRGGYHASHHLLLAHARLREACRSAVRGARIGIANHNLWVVPRNPASRRDGEAAAILDDGTNRAYLDPLFKGTYPERVIRGMGKLLPRDFEGDLAEIHGVEDFVGVNYYNRIACRWAALVPHVHAREWMDPSAPRSAMWEIYPQGLYLTLRRLKEEYGNPPCIVTENGYPLPDRSGADPLDDAERIAYLTDHIAMVGKAIESGIDCRGYFHWSLLDNFEWDLGTTMRFGLIRTDFATQKREWKRSARWYQELVRANSLEIERVPAIEA